MVSYRAEDRYRPRNPDRRIVLISRDSTRTFTVRPWIAGLAAALVAALSVAYLGATAYLIYRDDLINTVVARNAHLQQAYEDRIASLRSEIDKIASRQILDQVAFDDKVDRLLAAHRALDDRSNLITGLIDRARESGLITDAGAIGHDDHAAATGYADDGAEAIERRFAALTDVDDGKPGASARADDIPLDEEGRPDIRVLTSNLARIDREQTDAVHAIASAATARADAVTGIVADLGITLKLPQRTTEKADAAALGGPYVPLTSSEALASALAEADTAFGTLGSLKTAVAKVPLQVPLDGASMSSNFGSRSDPFLGSVAFHAGVDFRSPSGRPVAATASGRVVVAGRNGGYGNLVEIDHGKGLTTRYAHLSRIAVKVGEEIAAGDIIGRVGSTGRSTGPHLHYETRVNGTAVNPQRYLAAGRQIAKMLR
ncbi:MAG TPA: M23 family metallopeptidase [Methylomirabilota bacterium]|nr:M23 family metallopeptidase [Methylomirabilota bacterium]